MSTIDMTTLHRGATAGAAKPRIALFLWYLALWLLLGRYWGLQHDAQLYVLQGLARLTPDLYANDIYLRYAGNAQLTAFPTVVAAFVSAFGINGGSALLTLVSVMAWYVAAWVLLCRIIDRDHASLAFGLLLVIPLWYGSHQIFRLAEPFLSARPLAEGLSIAMVAAVLTQHHAVACLLAVAALAIHPLMAFPAVLVALGVASAGRIGSRSAPFAVVLLVVGTLLAATVLGGTDRLMSGEWLTLTRQRSSYLFADTWRPEDWQNAVVPIATVALAVPSMRDSPIGRLALASLLVGVAGLALTVISSVLPLTLILQGQPWRWTWPAGFVALASLVVLVPRLWRGTQHERAIGLTLLAAWLLRDWTSSEELPPIGAGGLLACLALGLWLVRHRLSSRAGSLLERGAYVLCGVIITGLFASTLPIIARDSHFTPDAPWLQLGIELMKAFPPLAASVVVCAWILTARQPLWRGDVLVGIAALGVGTAAFPTTLQTWTRDPLSNAERSTFASWRSIIPEGVDVFWFQFPQGPWFLLERPSYLSTSQLAGIVFSHALVGESRQRAAALGPGIDPDLWFGGSEREIGYASEVAPETVCRAPGIDYAVLERDSGTALAAAEWPGPGHHIYLYECKSVRSANPGAKSSTREPGHTRGQRQAT